MSTAFEVENKFTQVLLIFLRGRLANFDARGEAEISIESFLAVVRFVVIRKNFAKNTKSLLDGGFSIKRTDVSCFIVLRSACETDIRDFGFHVDSNVRNGFVIAKEDIPLRHIAFNHLGLEKEGVHFGIDDDPVSISNLAHERLGFRILFRVVEILADAVLQNGSLADIDDFVIGVFMKVNTRGSGKSFEFLEEFFTHSRSDRRIEIVGLGCF
jgi:hypothetical protein